MTDLETQRDLLIRIDERTRDLCSRMERMELHMEKNFVTIKEFTPVKNLAYGAVGTILLAIIGATLTLIIR